MEDLYRETRLNIDLDRLARMQRHATIIAGLAAKRPDGKIDPVSVVRDARLIDAELVKQDGAE